MSIEVAKSAGFCFGVDRSVQMVYQLLDEGKKVYTLGPIIHNPQMIAELEARGVEIIETVEVDLRTLEVVQCHGKHNQDTEYHERIIDLVNKNANLIRERMKAA